jgi:hypothetical protein
MQNLYGNALDDGMNSVIDYVNPQPDMMSGGPMSRDGYRHYQPQEVMALATEAEMGSSPYQETDTGPGLMMSGGPMTRGENRSRSVTNPNYDAPGSYYYQDPDDAKTQAMLNLRPQPIEPGPAGQSRRRFGESTARFVTRPIAEKYMDINDGTPMSYNDFDKYTGRQMKPTTEKPKSDWAKWKASMNSGRS